MDQQPCQLPAPALPECLRDSAVLAAGVGAFRRTAGSDVIKLQAAISAMAALTRKPAEEMNLPEHLDELTLAELRKLAGRYGVYYVHASTPRELVRGLRAEAARRGRVAESSRDPLIEMLVGSVLGQGAETKLPELPGLLDELGAWLDRRFPPIEALRRTSPIGLQPALSGPAASCCQHGAAVESDKGRRRAAAEEMIMPAGRAVQDARVCLVTDPGRRPASDYPRAPGRPRAAVRPGPAVGLAWPVVDGADGYVIERMNDRTGVFEVISSPSANRFIDQGEDHGIYRVRSRRGGLASLASSWVTVIGEPSDIGGAEAT